MTINIRWIGLCIAILLLDAPSAMARGAQEVLRETPVAVSAISGESLRASGAADIGDLVNKQPYVYGYDSNPQPNINIRGVGQLQSGAPLIIVDGVPMQDGLASLDPNAIQSVNVLRGASAAALYGSSGTNGVVIVRTNRPGDDARPTYTIAGNGGCGANDGVPLPSSVFLAGSSSLGQAFATLTDELRYPGSPRDTDTGASDGADKYFGDNFSTGGSNGFNAIQQFPGISQGSRFSSTIAPDFEFDISENFSLRAGLGYNIGDNYYLPYYGLDSGMDFGALDTVPGQGGVTRDYCTGSAAFAGALQLTASVASIGDEWAIERVLADATGAEGGAPIIVGVVDTGLDWDHLDLAPESVWQNEGEIPANGIDDDGNGYVDDIIGWDFVAESASPWDFDGHGTFVAGVIAATHGNDAGIEGVSPSAKIMVLKALNAFGDGRGSDIAQAIAYGADNGARIINVSIDPKFPPVVQEAVDYAVAKGVLVIVAAGNEAANLDALEPAGLRNVMTVAATTSDDRRAAFSNTGSSVSVAAPGVDVVSLRARRTDFMHQRPDSSYRPGEAFLGEDKRYYRASGTSFSAALTSGVASLVWSKRPMLRSSQVQRILEQSARDAETPGKDRFTGYGIVDASAAMTADPNFFVDAAILGARQMDKDGQAYLQIVGTAEADNYAGAILEIGPGEEPEEWTPVEAMLTFPVKLGKLAEVPLLQFAAASTWTVRLVVDHANGRQREARYVIEFK